VGIVDRRELEFDSRALVSILGTSPDRAQAIGLPPQKPTGVEFDPRGGRVVFSYDERTVQVSAGHLGALLVSYCIRARIPLPRLPAKEISITASAVVIVFQTLFLDAPAV
jgi:hypothetical protein